MLIIYCALLPCSSVMMHIDMDYCMHRSSIVFKVKYMSRVLSDVSHLVFFFSATLHAQFLYKNIFSILQEFCITLQWLSWSRSCTLCTGCHFEPAQSSPKMYYCTSWISGSVSQIIKAATNIRSVRIFA